MIVREYFDRELSGIRSDLLRAARLVPGVVVYPPR